MEFYELNRLYDKNLDHFNLSKIFDRYLYILLPIIVLFGCGTSLISIIALSRPYYNLTSKKYLLSQSLFNFLFQIITTIILITNYYEKQLIDNYNNVKYFTMKIYLNIGYNIILYCLLWLCVIGALDFCFISIIKFHYNLNYNKLNRKLFYQIKVQFNYQQKLLQHQQSRLRNSQRGQMSQNQQPINPHFLSQSQKQNFFSTSSSRTSYSFNPNGTVEESLPPELPITAQNTSEATTTNQCLNYADVFLDESNMFELANFESHSKKKTQKN